jgi:hypothetical protein
MKRNNKNGYIGNTTKNDTLSITGTTDNTRGFLQLGGASTNPVIGFNGNSQGLPAVADSISGSILSYNNHLYFYNGTSGNGGWAQVI